VRKSFTVLTAVAAVGLLGMGVAAAGGPFSFGLFRDQQLANHAKDLFGVGRPIAASSTQQLTQAAAAADPTKLATLARGLRARVVTTQGPVTDDQISLWPDSKHPTHLIACNEEGTATPGLVRIELATRKVSTIVTGTTSCDPTRRTPWGTIVFGEEAGQGGRLYELIDPVHTTGVTLDRTTGTFSGGAGADHLITRTALGTAAFEGLGILGDGTSYLDGDDSDLGPKNGGPGDSLFKFIPDHPFHGTTPITNLSQSPWTSGRTFGLRVGLSTNF
jgi:hypothetical protein